MIFHVTTVTVKSARNCPVDTHLINAVPVLTAPLTGSCPISFPPAGPYFPQHTTVWRLGEYYSGF